MTTDRETTRIVRSWIQLGVDRMPERVLDAVLDELPATPQRRSLWPAWRSPPDAQLVAAKSSAVAAVVLLARRRAAAAARPRRSRRTRTASPSPSLRPRPRSPLGHGGSLNASSRLGSISGRLPRQRRDPRRHGHRSPPGWSLRRSRPGRPGSARKRRRPTAWPSVVPRRQRRSTNPLVPADGKVDPPLGRDGRRMLCRRQSTKHPAWTAECDPPTSRSMAVRGKTCRVRHPRRTPTPLAAPTVSSALSIDSIADGGIVPRSGAGHGTDVRLVHRRCRRQSSRHRRLSLPGHDPDGRSRGLAAVVELGR